MPFRALTVAIGLSVLMFLSAAFAQDGGQQTKDPHRPHCKTVECRKVRSFVKTHYCGAPQGNGPEDSCEIQEPEKHPNVKITASYHCKWVDGVRSCEQQGQPPTEMRDLLIGELRRLGLPGKARGRIYFTVWQPIGLQWSLAEAYYDHIDGSNVTLCQVIEILDENSRASILWKVPWQKTDADKNTVTTWSPLDLADINADGKIEVVLEGDAYEDHWIEVASMKDGAFRTIFSGLGYYL